MVFSPVLLWKASSLARGPAVAVRLDPERPRARPRGGELLPHLQGAAGHAGKLGTEEKTTTKCGAQSVQLVQIGRVFKICPVRFRAFSHCAVDTGITYTRPFTFLASTVYPYTGIL